MNYEAVVDVAARPEVVWSVVTDIEAWPQLTPSMRSVAWVDGSSMAVGARARIEQPGLRPALWTVTQVQAGTSFSWQSVAPWITTAAVHEVVPAPGGSRLRLAIAQTGPLAGVIGLVFGTKAKRYVDMEAAGIKRRAEELGVQA